MFAETVKDIQNDEQYIALYDEISKYKTLSHGEIQWEKVFDESLALLKISLDTRVLRGFVLSIITLNNSKYFTLFQELLLHYTKYWKEAIKSFDKSNIRIVKIQNKFLQEALSELVENNNQQKINIDEECVKSINNSIDLLNNDFNFNIPKMVVFEKPKEEQKIKENISTYSSATFKSSESMDMREYREYFFNIAKVVLAVDILNPAGYNFFYEGCWGKITKEPAHKNNITEIRFPQENTCSIIKNTSEFNYQNIISMFSNIMLNPFWFEGYKYFIDLAKKNKAYSVAKQIKLLVLYSLNKFPALKELMFSNSMPFCSEELYKFFLGDNQPKKEQETVKKKKTAKSLHNILEDINSSVENSTKSYITSLLKIADTLYDNSLENNAAIIYCQIAALMENTYLKDYLTEEYEHIQSRISFNQEVEKR
ncbi:MAG: type VI secretion system domain-containing protein [Mucispirillum sp.]|nr:type VI secretion system domain-containing protein [Mucispirillum sp.]